MSSQGSSSTWAAAVPVQSGVNVVTLTATDHYGDSASTTVTITTEGFLYYLAEGATGDVFDTDIVIANPNAVPAPVTVTFFKDDATLVVKTLVLPPASRQTLRLNDIPELAMSAFSTIVESTAALPLFVERSMFW